MFSHHSYPKTIPIDSIYHNEVSRPMAHAFTPRSGMVCSMAAQITCFGSTLGPPAWQAEWGTWIPDYRPLNIHGTTWWLIPLSKWVITPVINGISRVNPLIIGVITHLLSGMNHQVVDSNGLWSWMVYLR